MSWPRLDTYANAMFSLERLHEGWIESCANYVQSLFGEQVKDATVIDYGFGRGNWSLAFLRAGARRVIAVDASISNVRRLSDYCRLRDIEKIQVVHGNAVDAPLDVSSDIVWLYGVLHHVSSSQLLLERLVGTLRTEASSLLAYAYDAGSLRQAIVEAVRQVVVYANANEFLEDSLRFIPAARLRARDDLTAPFIRWYDETELDAELAAVGLAGRHAVSSFDSFLGRPASLEFRPHHVLCRRSGSASSAFPARAPTGHEDDALLIDEMARTALTAPPDVSRTLAIGLFNAHFAALAAGGFSQAVLDDFLYLLYASTILERPSGAPSSRLAATLALAEAALAGEKRSAAPELMKASGLVRHLVGHTIRL